MSMYDPKPRRRRAQETARRFQEAPQESAGQRPMGAGKDVDGPAGWAGPSWAPHGDQIKPSKPVKKDSKIKAPKGYDFGSGRTAQLVEKYLNFQKGDLHGINMGAGGKDELRAKIKDTRRDIRREVRQDERKQTLKPTKPVSMIGDAYRSTDEVIPSRPRRRRPKGQPHF